MAESIIAANIIWIGLLLVIGLAWLFLPFMVCSRLTKLIKLGREQNKLLKEMRDMQVAAQKTIPPQL